MYSHLAFISRNGWFRLLFNNLAALSLSSKYKLDFSKKKSLSCSLLMFASLCSFIVSMCRYGGQPFKNVSRETYLVKNQSFMFSSGLPKVSLSQSVKHLSFVGTKVHKISDMYKHFVLKCTNIIVNKC